MESGRTFFGALLVGATLVAPDRARAEDTAAPTSAPSAPEDAKVAMARAAFEEGIDLARQGRWTEALAAFERSDRLRPHAVTTYNIGFCELSLRQYTLAKKDISTALAARDETGAAALPEDLRHSAEEYSVEAEQSLVHLVLTLVPDTARVSIDGRPLDILADATGTSHAFAGTRDTGPAEAVPGGKILVDLDPGSHLFQVQVVDGPARAVQRSFAMGAREQLQLVAPTTAAAPDNAAVEPRSAPTRAAAPDVAPSRVPAYVVLGIGAAGLLTGSVAGIVAITKRTSLHGQCPQNGCPAGKPTDTLSAANTAATVADVGFGVGAVGVLVGGYLWWATRPPSHAAPQAGIQPSIGWEYAGVSGQF